MTSMITSKLPPFAPYPAEILRSHLRPDDWDSLYQAWHTLSQAYLDSLSDDLLAEQMKGDASVANFLSAFASATSQAESVAQTPSPPPQLLKSAFHLTSRVLLLPQPPASLLSSSFLSDVCKVYPRKRAEPLIARAFQQHAATIETSLTSLKRLLIPQLDAGIKGDLSLVESRLARLNCLLHNSPEACALFLAGSDFLDGLVTCFRVMNPPLRKVIITTVYLCVTGLTEGDTPKFSMLSDQLYALKEAADVHRSGPLNVNDSLVAELVTSSPILKILLRRIERSETATDALKRRVTALEEFRKGPTVRPKRLVRRKLDLKGKGKQTAAEVQAELHVHRVGLISQVQAELHVHRVGLISQVQDIFPDLGDGFVARCLDEYNEDVEQVVANLLGESLPQHLASADRSEQLSYNLPPSHYDIAPSSTPPPPPAPQTLPAPPSLPSRRNIHDDDDFDRLAVSASHLSFGKKPVKDADALLQDRSSVPAKAAILAALAAFDSDDDERDDTYDDADVGGVVADTTNQEADGVVESNEEALFRAYQLDSRIFARDADTRRSGTRRQLRDETGMTDEAIEGWAVVLARNPQQKKRLDAKYAFAGEQAQLEKTSWRASGAASGTEDSDSAPHHTDLGRGGRGRGRGRGGGRGRGAAAAAAAGRGGSASGATGDKDTEAARRRKEANKGSRANHNRREGRAKKMARGGFMG